RFDRDLPGRPPVPNDQTVQQRQARPRGDRHHPGERKDPDDDAGRYGGPGRVREGRGKAGPGTLRQVRGRVVENAMERLIEQGEELMLKRLRELPHGTFMAEDWVDDDGITDNPVQVKAKVEISDQS